MSVEDKIYCVDQAGFVAASKRCEGCDCSPDRARPKVIVICGSSRFVDIMAVVCWLLERDEGVIAMALHLLPQWYGAGGDGCPEDHLAEHEGIAAQMDELHLRKIDLADEIFVVNRADYIGDSTRREVEYARRLGKPIRWYNNEPNPIKQKVEAMLTAWLESA